jgi:hypothetical protein
MQLNTKGSETSAIVTEEDDDDEEAAPPVIAPRPDHTKSVSDWLMTARCVCAYVFWKIAVCNWLRSNFQKPSSLSPILHFSQSLDVS